MSRRPLFLLALLPVLATMLAGCDPARSTIGRPDDPVVLSGSSLARLHGRAPGRLVGFRYTPEAGWSQMPVQVDERAVVDFGEVPSSNATPGVAGTIYGSTPTGVATLQYTDPNTFTGADPNSSFDADDELVFMARDAGGLAPDGAAPAGVVPTSAVQVTVTDPLNSSAVGWFYLYETTGGLQPSAGRSYVSYSFSLLSGAYRTTYKRADGPNLEDSVVTTARYSHHFGDRWLDDSMRVTAGNSTGVDILDRHKNLFAPDVCGRSENTFNDGEGAFVVNKVGPVRAIRSYIGANSGPLTQRTHLFYEGRHDIITDLRVHAIPSVMDFMDYSPAASGMRYRNDRNTAGFPVDGAPETPAAGRLRWEMVSGAQGTVVHSTTAVTNIASLNQPNAVTSYYLDDSTPATVQCTGDPHAYGSSGTWVNTAIPDTDLRTGTANRYQATRSITYLPPGQSVANAELIADRDERPLTTVAANR